MALRVNQRRSTRDEYQQRLSLESIVATPVGKYGLMLEKPVPVERLPGFAAGRPDWAAWPAAASAAQSGTQQSGARCLCCAGG